MGAASPRMNCCDVDDVVSKKLQVGQLADPELKKKKKKQKKTCCHDICKYVHNLEYNSSLKPVLLTLLLRFFHKHDTVCIYSS